MTKKRRHGWSLDASYSYGSFNTHKSYVNFSHTLRNGLAYEINAFQNYSDNNYWIDNYITEFGDDGISENTDRSKIYHVRRFNDRFHNEAVIGKFGVTGKSWADRLMLGFNYSHFYKEIQTGVYQYIVFGQKHRKGHSLVRRPQIHRKPGRAVLPGQPLPEHQFQRHLHRRIPAEKSPYLHTESRLQHIPPHHPLQGGRQPAAVRLQHSQSDQKEHNRPVVQADAV